MSEAATLTLADFLLARIAEDEADVRADIVGRRWPNPARALAECEAKRQIVEWHQPATGGPFEQGTCTCEYDDWSNDNPPYPCPTLRYLAAVYADHPDFRAEWRARP